MKLIYSAFLSLSLVLLLSGAGTWAQLSDTEKTSGNVTSGTMDLYMRDNGPCIDCEWVLTDMVPGETFTSGELNLYNNGTVEADHVEITFSTVCRDPGYEAGANEESDTLDGADGMDSYLKVDSMTYRGHFATTPTVLVQNGGLATSYIGDTNSNGYIDLADLNGLTLDNLEAPLANNLNDTEFDMQISFDESAPNDYQGDECTLRLSFTLNQEASQ